MRILILLALLALPIYAAQVEVGQVVIRETGCVGTDGVNVDADELPTGYASVNGSSVATITVTDIGTGKYKYSYTVPAQSEGDILTSWVSVIVDGVTYVVTIGEDEVISKRVSDLNDATQTSEPPTPTEIWAEGERTVTNTIPSAATIAGAVWSEGERTITDDIPTAGEISTAVWGEGEKEITNTIPAAVDVAAAVWAEGEREITGGVLDSAYDAAKSAAPTGETATVIGVAGANLTAIGDTRLANLDATVSSRAPSSTALSTAVWTAEKAGFLDAAVSEAGSGDAPTVEEIDAELTKNHGSGLWTGGATSETSKVMPYTLTIGGVPVADALCTAYADAACTRPIQSRRTNYLGVTFPSFILEPGVVYIWPRKTGYSFPIDEEVVPE